MPDLRTIPFIIAVFVLAGLVKGTIGLGLPAIGVGLLGLVMPPAQAAAMLVVPSLVTNTWQLLAGPGLAPLLRRLWPMLAGIPLGTWFAAGAIGAGRGAEAAMGAALMAYGLFGLLRLPLALPRRAEPVFGPIIGLANGVITAATGVFVLPTVPYLQAIGLAREDLIQALGLSFTVSTVSLAATLGAGGAFNTGALLGSALALIPSLLGMVAGGWLRSRVHPDTFRRWFFAGLLALGADLMWSGLR